VLSLAVLRLQGLASLLNYSELSGVNTPRESPVLARVFVTLGLTEFRRLEGRLRYAKIEDADCWSEAATVTSDTFSAHVNVVALAKISACRF